VKKGKKEIFNATNKNFIQSFNGHLTLNTKQNSVTHSVLLLHMVDNWRHEIPKEAASLSSRGFFGESSSGFGIGREYLRVTILSETFSRFFCGCREKERRHANKILGRFFVSIVLTDDLNHSWQNGAHGSHNN